MRLERKDKDPLGLGQGKMTVIDVGVGDKNQVMIIILS